MTLSKQQTDKSNLNMKGVLVTRVIPHKTDILLEQFNKLIKLPQINCEEVFSLCFCHFNAYPKSALLFSFQSCWEAF